MIVDANSADFQRDYSARPGAYHYKYLQYCADEKPLLKKLRGGRLGVRES